MSGKSGYLRISVCGLVFSGCFILAMPVPRYFFSLPGMFIVFSLVCPAIWLRLRDNIPATKTILVTAIPAGILATIIGFQGVTVIPRPLWNLAGSASTMTLTVVYGGFLAIVAYALRDKSDREIPTVNLVTVFPCILWMILVLYFNLRYVSENVDLMTLSEYLSPKVFLLFVGIKVLFMARGGLNNFARNLAESSIVGIMVCIVLALIVWFRGLTEGTIPKDATDFATLGLLYGTFLFIISYYVSLLTGETDEISFDIKNWHLIESAALYILLVFAPPSIFEIAG